MKKESDWNSSRRMTTFVLLISLSLALVGCSDSKDAINTSNETSSQTTTVTSTKSETKPTTESTTKQTTTQTTAKETSGKADSDGRYLADNKYINAFLPKFSQVTAGLGLSFTAMDSFFFTDKNITSTKQGRLTNVGSYYENNQVMVGMGYNMDKESMWYVSFEAPLPELSKLFEKYYFSTVFALNNNPIPMGNNEKEVTEFMDALYDTLVGDGQDKAVQMDNYVFVFKNTSKNRAVFAVDTLEYFNAYYKGSIKLITI